MRFRATTPAATILVAFLAIACNGGSDGPSGPDDGDGLQVSGTWMETAVVVSNPCQLELPGQASGTLTLSQSGSMLTATSEGVSITGTINSTTGAFTLSGTFTFSGLTITIVQNGTFSSSSQYTAETTFTITDGETTCVIETNDTGTRQ